MLYCWWQSVVVVVVAVCDAARTHTAHWMGRCYFASGLSQTEFEKRGSCSIFTIAWRVPSFLSQCEGDAFRPIGPPALMMLQRATQHTRGDMFWFSGRFFFHFSFSCSLCLMLLLLSFFSVGLVGCMVDSFLITAGVGACGGFVLWHFVTRFSIFQTVSSRQNY